jgi:hypothetical protein
VDHTLFAGMPTPFESAQLNLQLFALRRDPVLREARAWFLREFTPASFEELQAVAGGERNASFRMVLGYWDMAASLVTTGAVDGRAGNSRSTTGSGARRRGRASTQSRRRRVTRCRSSNACLAC